VVIIPISFDNHPVGFLDIRLKAINLYLILDWHIHRESIVQKTEIINIKKKLVVHFSIERIPFQFQ